MLGHLIAVLHLISLPLGVAVLMLRARALAQAQGTADLKQVFLWDNHYAGVALLWIGSGLFRAFGGFEKGTDYYLSNHAFWTKMAFLLVVLGAESVPVATFIRWRIRIARGESIGFERRALLLMLHWVELWAIVGMVAMAVLMSRGVGVVPAKDEIRTESPAALDSAGVRANQGEAIYRGRCVTCHQLDGGGLDGKLAADFRAQNRLDKPEDVLIATVANGVPNTAMRAFSPELSETEIRSVVRYVRERYRRADRPPK